MGAERVLLAELLFAKRDYRGAIAAASLLDAQQPIMVYLLYLPASLSIRLRAAQNLRATELERELQARWVALGRKDQMVVRH